MYDYSIMLLELLAQAIVSAGVVVAAFSVPITLLVLSRGFLTPRSVPVAVYVAAARWDDE